MRGMWTYSDGTLTVKGYWWPGGTARAGSWVLVDPATGNVQGVVPAGEFSPRFRPVDVFADVPGLSTYLGTVTAPDGTALVDLVLDRDPFMLANGPRRAARPHLLMVPRSHRDGWSSATAAELAACQKAMTLVAAWYRSLDGGRVVFCANDSAPNLDYLHDAEAASGTLAGAGSVPAITRNPRQDVQHAHLHAFYAEHDTTRNHESSAVAGHPVMAEGYRAFGAALGGAALGGDAVRAEPDGMRLAAGLRAAARPWGGSYCSYQLGVDGPFWVMPPFGIIPERGQPAPGPGRWPPGRPRPEPGRGHQPGPAQPGRHRAAPCGATGHSAAASQLRDLRGPARTERTVTTRRSSRDAARTIKPGPLRAAAVPGHPRAAPPPTGRPAAHGPPRHPQGRPAAHGPRRRRTYGTLGRIEPALCSIGTARSRGGTARCAHFRHIKDGLMVSRVDSRPTARRPASWRSTGCRQLRQRQLGPGRRPTRQWLQAGRAVAGSGLDSACSPAAGVRRLYRPRRQGDRENRVRKRLTAVDLGDAGSPG